MTQKRGFVFIEPFFVSIYRTLICVDLSNPFFCLLNEPFFLCHPVLSINNPCYKGVALRGGYDSPQICAKMRKFSLAGNHFPKIGAKIVGNGSRPHGNFYCALPRNREFPEKSGVLPAKEVGPPNKQSSFLLPYFIIL